MNYLENNSNQEILKVKFLINYDRKKTLNENFIHEQIITGIYPWSGKAVDFTKWNKHDWLTLIEIGATVAGIMAGGVPGLILAGIGFGAGVTDGITYFNEGDPYMGTMVLALSLIPGGELIKAPRFFKTVSKRGIKGTMDLIKRAKSGAELTEQEAKDLMKLGDDFVQEKEIVERLMRAETKKSIVETIKKYSPEKLIRLIDFINSFKLTGLSKLIIKVGGTVVSTDLLYLWATRDIWENASWLDSREKNEIRKVIVKLFSSDDEVSSSLKSAELSEQIGESIIILQENGVDLTPIDTTNVEQKILECKNRFLQKKQEEAKKQEETYKQTIISPSIQDVLSKKVDPRTNQRSAIMYPYQGDAVKEIQKMLYEIGYDEEVTNYKSLENWNDGQFGDATKFAVESFQYDNGLKEDGIVGFTTLTKLIDIYKQKLNSKNEKSIKVT